MAAYKDMPRPDLEALSARLAAALQDLLSSDPDMPSYAAAYAEAEAAVTAAEAVGLVAAATP